MEVIWTEPLVLLDGAHNPDKIAALADALAALYPGRRVLGVLAFKRGHDLPATLRQILPRLDRAIITSFEATTDYGPGQAINPRDLGRLLDDLGTRTPFTVVPNPAEAFGLALSEARPEDVVCVTGSLYLVGVARTWFRSAA
jgi:dihydrofolate synthase/folylpolyglutamate synthase